MKTYYEVKVKYLVIDQEGFERKKTSTFLFDAVSHTDAETQAVKRMVETGRRDFQIKGIKPSNITQVVEGIGELFFKTKISLVSIDEEKGKEKNINQYLLVSADDPSNALVVLEQELSYMLVPYTVYSVVLSPILDVFAFEEEKEEE